MKRRKGIWVRILSGILVVTVVSTYCATAAINVTLAANTDNAATNYLADNTEYINESKAQRLLSQIKTLQKPTDLDSYYRLASTKIAKEKYDEAMPYIEKCIELCKEDEEQSIYLSLLTKKGCLLTLLDRDEEAIEVLNEVIEKDSKQSDAYLVLAQICYEYNNFEGLVFSLENYLKLVPEDSTTRMTYAQILYTQGYILDAKENYEKVVNAEAAKEEQAEAKHYLSLIHLQNREFEEAYTYLKDLEQEKEVYKDIDCNMGLCQMSLGNYDEAIKYYTRSIENEYALQYSYYTRGICELTKDNADVSKALADLQYAADYAGDDKDEETSTLAKEMLDLVKEQKDGE